MTTTTTSIIPPFLCCPRSARPRRFRCAPYGPVSNVNGCSIVPETHHSKISARMTTTSHFIIPPFLLSFVVRDRRGLVFGAPSMGRSPTSIGAPLCLETHHSKISARMTTTSHFIIPPFLLSFVVRDRRGLVFGATLKSQSRKSIGAPLRLESHHSKISTPSSEEAALITAFTRERVVAREKGQTKFNYFGQSVSGVWRVGEAR